MMLKKVVMALVVLICALVTYIGFTADMATIVSILISAKNGDEEAGLTLAILLVIVIVALPFVIWFFFHKRKNFQKRETEHDFGKQVTKTDKNTNADTSSKNSDVIKAGARRQFEIEGVEFAFRYCPPGEFMMGSSDTEKGHKEQINEGFWICETPITQEQWDAVGVTKKHKCEFQGKELPVEYVTKDECDTFIRTLNELVTLKGWNFELPTEKQWEYACRAGTNGSDYGYSLDDCAWCMENSERQTQNVGMKQANNWGICDMLGNVWEYTNSKCNNSNAYIVRGGGWNNKLSSLQPTKFFNIYPNSKYDDVGFRCVCVRCQS